MKDLPIRRSEDAPDRFDPVHDVPEESGTTTADLESLYRLLVESVADYAIFVLDPEGRIATWNPGAQRIKGYLAGEIIGKHFSLFYPPEDVAAGKPEWVLKVLREQGRYGEEGWRVRKDGSLFWASVNITALRDPASGELRGFAKVTRDLTERRKAEHELRESEERFRLLVHSVKDYGIFMLDLGGHVASWNEGAHRISGYTSEEIIGKHFSTFYPAEDVAAGKPEWELKVVREEGHFEEEGWRLRKDGSLFWSNVTITALRDSHGELQGYSKVTRDLTERRKATERAIRDAARIAEMEASNRTRTEFLAAMSHELRTPLNAIGGYTDLLSMGVRGAVNEEQMEDLNRIRRSQQHLLGIINDLLNYSRIEAGQVTYQLEDVPVAELVAGVIPMIEPQALQKGIEFESIACDPPVTAHTDRAKVEQILLNLLSNAVKFTPAGGRIALRCGARAGEVSLSVSDTGVGIPEDQIEEIFAPFVQLGRSLTSSHEGTGLGLAISRDLARALGGEIVVKSRAGEGSTFTLTLPPA